VPKDFTSPESQNEIRCNQDGSSCKSQIAATDAVPRSDVEAGNKYPENFSWCHKDGVNYCTLSQNQHLPQQCESSWAMASTGTLADRIKIARKAQGIDIQLSVQHLLNCGSSAGTCKGGDAKAAFKLIKQMGDETGSGVAYTTGQPYLACSSDMKSGLCAHSDFTCNALNTARACGTFGQECVGLDHYPNATIADFGSVSGKDAMMEEIFERGPIVCNVDSKSILEYAGGIVTAESQSADLAVSVVGWGTDATQVLYWIARNSWGEYWGEQGYFNIKSGALAIEESCTWATVKDFTAPERNNQFFCYEDGSNCKSSSAQLIV